MPQCRTQWRGAWPKNSCRARRGLLAKGRGAGPTELVLDLWKGFWAGLGPEKKCWVWEMGTDPQHISIIPLRNLPPSSMASMPLRALPVLVSIRIPLFS